MTTFEKFWPLPKAKVLLTILRIFAVAWLLSVLTLLTKIAKIFAARVPRAREHHYTNFPLDLCIEYIGLTLAATPSAQMKMYLPCVAECGLLTQTHAEL